MNDMNVVEVMGSTDEPRARPRWQTRLVGYALTTLLAVIGIVWLASLPHGRHGLSHLLLSGCGSAIAGGWIASTIALEVCIARREGMRAVRFAIFAGTATMNVITTLFMLWLRYSHS